MKYYCEECGKLYNSEDEVRKCESKHLEAKRIAEEKANQKEVRWKEVCAAKEKYKKLYDEFMNDYPPQMPRIDLNRCYLPDWIF